MKNAILFRVTALMLLAASGCKVETRSPSADSGPAARTVTVARNHHGDFDYYLLNLSWSPEYCHFHRSARECAVRSAFVLHGLWPQNTSGAYPQNCTDARGPANPAEYSDIYPDAGLLEHEWRTHGTCSGLSPDEFFTTARQAAQSITIPPELTGITKQTSMPPEQILGLFTASNPGIPRSSFVLSCGNNYLTAIEVCLDQSLRPTACGEVRSCRANTVRITPP